MGPRYPVRLFAPIWLCRSSRSVPLPSCLFCRFKTPPVVAATRDVFSLSMFSFPDSFDYVFHSSPRWNLDVAFLSIKVIPSMIRFILRWATATCSGGNKRPCLISISYQRQRIFIKKCLLFSIVDLGLFKILQIFFRNNSIETNPFDLRKWGTKPSDHLSYVHITNFLSTIVCDNIKEGKKWIKGNAKSKIIAPFSYTS